MKNNFKYTSLLIALLAFASCETLEDTYSEYAGDGAVRYMGTPTDIQIVPKWGELAVTWQNAIDPNIEELEVSWKYTTNDGSYEFVDTLPKGTTSFVVPAQEFHDDANEGKTGIIDAVLNATIEVNIVSLGDKMDSLLNRSKNLTAYSRPYNDNHEEVLAYPTLVTSQYRTNGSLVLFFSDWSSKIEHLKVRYWTAAGEQELNYTQNNLPEDITIPGVSLDSIVVERDGYLGDYNAEDDTNNVRRVIATGIAVNREFNSEWLVLLDNKFPEYNGNYGGDFCDNVTELDVDFSMGSLNEILNFPNLKTINFGSNRYMGNYDATNPAIDTSIYYASVVEIEESKRALEILDVVNSGITANFYGKHFDIVSNVDVTTVNDLPNAIIDNSQTNYLFINSVEARRDSQEYTDEPGQSTYVNRLYDGDISSMWTPFSQNGDSRMYEFTFNITDALINSFEITQIPVTASTQVGLMPTTVKVQVSNDKITWIDASGEDAVQLGTSPNETTVVRIHPNYASTTYKHVKLTVNDNPYGTGFQVNLAEFRIVGE